MQSSQIASNRYELEGDFQWVLENIKGDPWIDYFSKSIWSLNGVSVIISFRNPYKHADKEKPTNPKTGPSSIEKMVCDKNNNSNQLTKTHIPLRGNDW